MNNRVSKYWRFSHTNPIPEHPTSILGLSTCLSHHKVISGSYFQAWLYYQQSSLVNKIQYIPRYTSPVNDGDSLLSYKCNRWIISKLKELLSTILISNLELWISGLNTLLTIAWTMTWLQGTIWFTLHKGILPKGLLQFQVASQQNEH